jgi:hypothetical protein
MTNKLAEDFTRLRAIQAVQVRWQVEEFHRAFQATDGERKMPMPKRGFAKKSFSLLLCGDYNGDGKQDIAVYREANRTFYWLNSPDFNNFSSQQWGATSGGNLPVGVLHTFIH